VGDIDEYVGQADGMASPCHPTWVGYPGGGRSNLAARVPTAQEGTNMARRTQKAIDPVATLDQAEATIEAGDREEAHRLLKAYRRWRLNGNADPPGGDERYGELVDRSGPKFTVVVAEPSPSANPTPPGDAVRPLARLLLDIVHRKIERYRGVTVDPVATLREAELALERGDLEAADNHLEDYDGFRVCGGEKHDLLWKRVSSLKQEPW
jgi:hypothetical protein